MSLMLKGIDLPKDTEGISITFHTADGWRETHIFDVTQAIQIPKGHGDIIDRKDVFTYCKWDEDALNEVTPLLKSED